MIGTQMISVSAIKARECCHLLPPSIWSPSTSCGRASNYIISGNVTWIVSSDCSSPSTDNTPHDLSSPITRVTFQPSVTSQMDEDLLTRNYFLVNIHGQIESSNFPGDDFDFVYCKCLFRNGPDWSLVNELKDNKEMLFISQTATKNEDERQLFVWNLPIEATFKSTNVFGWPQIVVSVYGADTFGNEVVRGYGWCHLPTRPGAHTLRIPLFTPQSSSLLNRITSWFAQSRNPEFVDSRLAAGSDGRSLVAVQNSGEVLVQVNVLFKDFKKFGFISR